MPARLTPWLKFPLSVAVVLHFICILVALVAPPMPGAPASALAGAVYGRLARHYLEPLNLTSPHRYYAPEIGPFSQVWFRIERANGAAAWRELPGEVETWTPIRYQRRFGISMALEFAGPDETLSPLGRIIVDSYARHVVALEDATPEAVRTVQVYQVFHRVRTPEEVRRGWRATDIRLYAPRFLGGYDGEGKPTAGVGDERKARTFFIPMSEFTASVLREDVRDDDLHLPVPLEELLQRHPELRRARQADDLAAVLRKRVADGEESGAAEW